MSETPTRVPWTARLLGLVACTLLAGPVSSLHASQPTHLWSRHFGDSDNQNTVCVRFTFDGGVLAVGHFRGSIDLGGGALSSAGDNDIFVARFDASGTHVWSQRFGSTGDQFVSDLAVDPVGNFVITGTYLGSIDFGGGALVSAGGNDLYVARFASNGLHQWSYRFGDAGNQALSTSPSVAMDGIGDVVMAGELDGTANFGGGVLSASKDPFIAKWNSAGSHSWSKVLGGPSNAEGAATDVATDDSANVVIAHRAFGTDFGGGSIAGFNMGLAKYSKSGDFLWANAHTRPGLSLVRATTVDASGRLVMAGEFSGTINLGGGDLSGSSAIFVARYDGNGGHLMSAAYALAANLNGDELHGLTTDSNRNIVVAGWGVSSTDWGGGGFGAGSGAILACYDSSGSHLSSQRFNDAEPSRMLTVDARATDVVAGGYLASSIDFGGGVLTSAGGLDAYVTRFSGGATTSVPSQGSELSLSQNYPNPFMRRTVIRFVLPHGGHAALRVYDLSGRLVRTLASGIRNAGTHRVSWDGRSDEGRAVKPGVYLYRLESEDLEHAGRMVLLE